MTGPEDLLAAYNRLGITYVLYQPALLNLLSADREPVGPLLQAALEEGYLREVVVPAARRGYRLLEVTKLSRQVGNRGF